jgi:general secretion pathway protein A
MYILYFGLKHEPFSIAPDPRYLFMSERHREALAHLLYGVKGGGGFVLLTGEIGAGKTTVCRCLLEQIPKRCNVAYIFNPKLTALELLKTVCEEFHVPIDAHEPGTVFTAKDYLDPFNRFLLQTHAVGMNNVLIIDEAQNLSIDVLEQLRLLTNLETNERKLLQIVLIGQPELRTMLRRPELEQVAQRVIARYHLEALSEAETVQYLRHRLAVAGLTSALPFTQRAMLKIHEAARGVPRRINLLADRALLGAYAESAPRADKRIVERAAAEVFGGERRGKAFEGAQHLAAWRSPWRLGLGGVALGLTLAGLTAWLWPRDGAAPARVAAASAPSATVAASAASAASTAARGPATVALTPVPAAAAASAAATTAATTATTTAATTAASATPNANAPTLAGDGTGPPPALTVTTPSSPLLLTAAEVAARNPWRSDAQAWRELAPQWGIALPDGSADPCVTAQRAQWQCFRTPTGGLPLVRQLDRPGFITLRDGTSAPAYALLISLTPRAATLRIGRDTVDVTLVSLAAMWPGDFATYWRAPDGYSGILVNGMGGPAVHTLAAQLASLRGEASPPPPVQYDNTLKGHVIAFQLTQGLAADGRAGPTTFMQLARAIGSATHEPRLTR